MNFTKAKTKSPMRYRAPLMKHLVGGLARTYRLIYVIVLTVIIVLHCVDSKE